MRSKRDTLPTGIPPEGRESQERVSISSHPRSGEAVTGPRAASSNVIELPLPWLERLLILWSELPVSDGDRAVTKAVVDAVGAMIPDCAVGACLVPADGAPQEVIRAPDPTIDGRGAGADPTRIFPAFTFERVVEIEPGGSTLHVAGEDPSCEDERSTVGALVTRAAQVARRGLELARVQARATEALAELRSLHQHMVQAEKLASLGQIAAGVVHELNNPLTSIVAYTDYLIRKALARTEPIDADDMERLRRISESANRMLRFTRDLVSYARPSSDVAVPVVLHGVIDQALAFCEHVIAEAGATIERKFGGDVLTVRGMPERLTQVFVNLVTNACHAMPALGGRLVIATSNDDAGVRIDFVDNGHGMETELLAKVFEPFFTTKSEGRGTGLGLSIVRNIVHRHGGTIRAESDGETGSRFILLLPAG